MLYLIFHPDFPGGAPLLNADYRDTLIPLDSLQLDSSQQNQWRIGRDGESAVFTHVIIGGAPPTLEGKLFSRIHCTLTFSQGFWLLWDGGTWEDKEQGIHSEPSRNGVWHYSPETFKAEWLKFGDPVGLHLGDRIQLTHQLQTARIIVTNKPDPTLPTSLWNDLLWPTRIESDDDDLPDSSPVVAEYPPVVPQPKELPPPIPEPKDGPWFLGWGVEIANWLLATGRGWIIVFAAMTGIGAVAYYYRNDLWPEPDSPVVIQETPWSALKRYDPATYTDASLTAISAEIARLKHDTDANRALLRVYTRENGISIGRLAVEVYSTSPGVGPVPPYLWAVSLQSNGYAQAQEQFNQGECAIRKIDELSPTSPLGVASQFSGTSVILSCSDEHNEHGYVSIDWNEDPGQPLINYKPRIQESVERIGEILDW